MGQELNENMPLEPERGCILLVEDDELVRQTIHMRFSRLGYSVIAAKNAEEALEVLHVGPKIDLVFSDVVMPGKMNGADLARQIRERWPSINILLTTGYADTSLFKVSAPQGVKVLAKPYSNALLDDLIRENIVA